MEVLDELDYLRTAVGHLQQALEDAAQERLALAMLLVKAAGGQIIITPQVMVMMDPTKTTYLEEFVDPMTSNKILTVREVPSA